MLLYEARWCCCTFWFNARLKNEEMDADSSVDHQSLASVGMNDAKAYAQDAVVASPFLICKICQ